jgi:hypothetical protein
MSRQSALGWWTPADAAVERLDRLDRMRRQMDA